MQDYVVISRVEVVPVTVPVRCTPVDFHISGPDHLVQSDTGIKEIWSGMGILLPGMQNLQGLSTGGAQ
jgi:hypothetical protein